MNKKQIIYLILTIIFIALNVSVIFLAIWGNNPNLTLGVLGGTFVLGVLLYFLMRFHKREMEYRQSIKEPKTDPNPETNPSKKKNKD